MEFSESRAAFISSIIACCLATVVSVFTVVATTLAVPQFRAMFAELGVELPLLTKLVLSPALLGVIPAITVSSVVKEFLIKNKTLTLVLNGVHAVLAFTVLGVYAVGLYMPLISTMSSMSAQ